MRKINLAIVLFACLFLPESLTGQIEKDVITAMSFRNLGPAFMTGRISDIVKDPTDPSTWYVATASSNVWKTTNNGTTWSPIFDNYNSFSTGCITLDPSNPKVIWLGTGENQSQRSVGWGDGIYKSLDAGKSWTNMGLANSEHIGRIIVDPRDPDIVLVAAQGPLWKAGGDRGIYRSSDGGVTWERVLFVSENTGAAELVFDPTNPDIIYASTYQRRRHVGILVAGGPESRIYKSEDNGKSWRVLKNGLPGGNLGRIGLAVSPQKPEVVYAQLVGEGTANGFYRSSDYGESWVKKSDYTIVDPQYYGEIYCDPHRFDHVYVMDVWIHKTNDGGANFDRLNSRFKHVDNHSILFDPVDPDYMMVGCDGGIYESWDHGDTWKYHDNLPIVQFYRVGIDNDKPFYNVYGGTQDNSTLFAPSQTQTVHGVTNAEWTLALGGDGFQARIDPEDPNTVYCQSQYAGIVRYNRASGERTELQPQAGESDDALRWHWDSPLLISPHNSKRVYFAAQRLFRSDDRGDSWRPVSGDLSRGEDRNEREVMGKIWPPEAVWKNVFTSPYGTIVSLSESELKEGLIAVGTDDGQIQVTEDGGVSWQLYNQFPGIPDRAYVSDLILSKHQQNTMYAVFNNHKEGDYNSYILKTEDLGESWELINEGIPSPHASWTIMEDHISEDLLFAGTEFGLFCSVNGGQNWHRMKGGLPTIPVRDLEIHRGENDLVCATFGRGMWILDDYSLLRNISGRDSEPLLEVSDGLSFPLKGSRGYRKKGVFGDNFFTTDNPSNGPKASIYLPEAFQSLKQKRKKAEDEEGLDKYPTYEQLKAEDIDENAQIFVQVRDESGAFLAQTPVRNKKGFQQITLNLRRLHKSPDGEVSFYGPPVREGNLSAQLYVLDDGSLSELSETRTFVVSKLPFSEEPEAEDFYQFYTKATDILVKAVRLNRAVDKRLSNLNNQRERGKANSNDVDLLSIENERKEMLELQYILDGDKTLRSRFEYFKPGVLRQIRRVYGNMRQSSQITQTHRDLLSQASDRIDEIIEEHEFLIEN